MLKIDLAETSAPVVALGATSSSVPEKQIISCPDPEYQGRTDSPLQIQHEIEKTTLN